MKLFGGLPDPNAAVGAFSHSEAFMGHLGLEGEVRTAVQRCLDTFPEGCESRGLFFEGLIETLTNELGAADTGTMCDRAGFAYRLQSFALYPHRDFYRLFYQAARKLHPTRPLPEGLSRIAELFYPNMFAKNLAGKTLAAFLRKDPVSVMARLVDAYRIAVPWTEHRFEAASAGSSAHRWMCKVEPCPFYPTTFAGIATGMVRSVTGHTPVLEVIDHVPELRQQRFVFRVEL